MGDRTLSSAFPRFHDLPSLKYCLVLDVLVWSGKFVSFSLIEGFDFRLGRMDVRVGVLIWWRVSLISLSLEF